MQRFSTRQNLSIVDCADLCSIGGCANMRLGLRILAVSILMGVMLTQFTNCDVYSQSGVFSGTLGSTCSGNGCVSQNADILELASVSQIYTTSTSVAVDLGGDCNEGGFPSNVVFWQLIDNAGNIIKDCSKTTGLVCGICQKGRFRIYASTGLVNSTYRIRLQIRGYDGQGLEYSNPIAAKKEIPIKVF